jgi:hypothetical protein
VADQDDRGISEETRVIAAEALHRAATTPVPAAITAMEAKALAKDRGGMSPAEIRDLAATAVEQAQQISHLMARLAGLLDDDDSPPGGARG